MACAHGFAKVQFWGTLNINGSAKVQFWETLDINGLD